MAAHARPCRSTMVQISEVFFHLDAVGDEVIHTHEGIMSSERNLIASHDHTAKISIMVDLVVPCSLVGMKMNTLAHRREMIERCPRLVEHLTMSGLDETVQRCRSGPCDPWTNDERPKNIS